MTSDPKPTRLPPIHPAAHDRALDRRYSPVLCGANRISGQTTVCATRKSRGHNAVTYLR